MAGSGTSAEAEPTDTLTNAKLKPNQTTIEPEEVEKFEDERALSKLGSIQAIDHFHVVVQVFFKQGGILRSARAGEAFTLTPERSPNSCLVLIIEIVNQVTYLAESYPLYFTVWL